VPPPWSRDPGAGPDIPAPPPRRSWFIRHKILTVVGAVFAMIVVLGGIGAAVGDNPTGQSQLRPITAAAGTQSATPAPSSAAPSAAAPTAVASAAPTTAKPAPPPVPATAAVPNVVGKRLDAAAAVLAAAGFTDPTPMDGTGRDRIVVNPNNWVVQNQKPAAGTRVSVAQAITLTVVKPSDSSAGGTVQSGVVPNVVCKDLQAAQDTLQAAGFYNLGSQDGSGQGRAQLIDRNWVVIRQSVATGSKPGPTARIVLTAVKYGEPTGASGCPS
jgi:PASTA domain